MYISLHAVNLLLSPEHFIITLKIVGNILSISTIIYGKDMLNPYKIGLDN